jgi:hypothetical protein
MSFTGKMGEAYIISEYLMGIEGFLGEREERGEGEMSVCRFAAHTHYTNLRNFFWMETWGLGG